MTIKNQFTQKRIDTNNKKAYNYLSNEMYYILLNAIKKGAGSLVFLFIGSDKSTGDCLGPLTGYKMDFVIHDKIFFYGNLENPVNAVNLDETLNQINTQHVKPYIIVIDACLGKKEHIGQIVIGEGSIKPGLGVKKDMTPVGNMYIIGIVNSIGSIDYMVLQNTKLSIVMKMADIISLSIRRTLVRIVGEYTWNKIKIDNSLYLRMTK